MPSAIMATPSLRNVPITRLVKKPRLSLTTIGVFFIPIVTSNALASVASEVRSPRMISTSGILSTGEKKCRPMKSPGRSMPLASSVIGSVEVLEHSSASGSMIVAASRKTSCLSCTDSNTASITMSQPARSL